MWVIPIERFKSERPTPYLDAAIHNARCAGAATDLDKVVAMPRWTLHDLQRTVRSEFPRLAVADVVSERVINHAPQGLHKIYDLYAYEAEKRDALERWGHRLQDLITPRPANVLKLQRARHAGGADVSGHQGRERR